MLRNANEAEPCEFDHFLFTEGVVNPPKDIAPASIDDAFIEEPCQHSLAL